MHGYARICSESGTSRQKCLKPWSAVPIGHRQPEILLFAFIRSENVSYLLEPADNLIEGWIRAIAEDPTLLVVVNRDLCSHVSDWEDTGAAGEAEVGWAPVALFEELQADSLVVLLDRLVLR